MLDKAWVHYSRYEIYIYMLHLCLEIGELNDLLSFSFNCRLDTIYEKGAWDFVRAVSAGKGDSHLIICPCKECRNVDRHSGSDVVDHLVRWGMDEDYKRRKDWYHHGELKLSG